MALVSPNTDRAAERRAATRREIVSAAWDVARDRGLAQITLREVAARVGMQAPSLYGHVASKHAIYDAMFAEAWGEYAEELAKIQEGLPVDLAGTLHAFADQFVRFATADPVRNQLMNQRTIPGFEPTAEAYAPAVAVLEVLTAELSARGVTAQEDVDLFVALVGGLADSQLANDPGGDRWTRLVPRAVEMFVRDLDSRTTEPHPEERNH